MANKDPIHFNSVPNVQDSAQRTVHCLDHPNNPSKLCIQCSNISELSKYCNTDMSRKIEDCYRIHRAGKVVEVVHFQHELLLLLEALEIPMVI